LPEHVWLFPAQSSQAAPLFPHAVWDVPAMHKSFKQQPFAHDSASQRAPPPPTPPVPVLALLEEEPPPPVLAPLLLDVTPPLDPTLAPLLPDTDPPPELAAPLGPSSPPLASVSTSLPCAHAASQTATTPIMLRNR
jgi:hypothetical protein